MKSTAQNIDCMLGMKEYPDKYFELAIVDVNYGIGEGGGKNHSRGKLAVSKNYKDYGDTESPDREYWAELFRLSKNQIIWGANHFISKIPFDSPAWYVWDKINGKTDFADCELAWTSFNCSAKLFRFRWQGMLQGDMKNKEMRIHPNQKPVKVYKDLLDKYAKEGDKILDTHLGSGSSRIACYDYGFDFTGFELDKDYFEAQEKRFKDHISQTNLFKVA